MATTARPFEVGSLGVRDTTGAVVASAKVRWYNPGTLTPATAYTDPACATPATAPLTANAAGQFSLYFLEPVRVIIKDTTETTTYYDDIAALNRADSVYITHASFNSGAETTLENVLTSLGANLGANGAYKESSGATARTYGSYLQQLEVSVKDFAAVGDGTTDDTTAVQAAFTEVKALGGGWVYFPKGTYKITSAIALDTAGVSARGAGRGVATIKNFSTTGNAITVSLGASADCKMVFKDFSITANTVSSGSAISFTNALYPQIHRVGISLHRTGIAGSTATGAVFRDIRIESTDDNAAAVGVSLAFRARLSASEIVSSTDNGTGVSGLAESRVVDCFVNNFATGVSFTGAGAACVGCDILSSPTGVSITSAQCLVTDTTVDTSTTGISLGAARGIAKGCQIDTCTTGISLAANNTSATLNTIANCTTGVSVGAFSTCHVVGNLVSGNTTDLSVNPSATLLVEHSNGFSAISDSATTPHSWLKDRGKVLRITKTTDSTTTPSITPTPQTCDIYAASLTTGGAMSSCTINATSTTGLVDGQVFTLVLDRTAGSGTPTPSYNAQYLGIGTPSQLSIGTAPGGGTHIITFVWRASPAKWMAFTWSIGASTTPSNANW